MYLLMYDSLDANGKAIGTRMAYSDRRQQSVALSMQAEVAYAHLVAPHDIVRLGSIRGLTKVNNIYRLSSKSSAFINHISVFWEATKR